MDQRQKNRIKPGPLPLSRTLKPEEVRAHRRLNCEGYDACLDTAWRNGWTSFSCRGCKRFRKSESKGRTAVGAAEVAGFVLAVLCVLSALPMSEDFFRQ